MQQKRFALADVGRDFLVAPCLTGLPLQALGLAGHLAQHIVEAGHVGFSGFQAQFRFMTAGVQTGNASGIFQNAAALFRLGVDDLADLALPNKRRRARAGRRIFKQNFDIAGAHILAVNAVSGTGFALNAPRYFENIIAVEFGGRLTQRVIEKHRDFGDVTFRARGGAGKNHIVHGGGAHRLVRGLAHHPTQCFEKI